MGESVFQWLGLAWGVWCAVNVVLFLLGAWLLEPEYPHFNGFAVRIPKDWRERMTQCEVLAVMEHELGHKHHHHVWRNLGRLCLCWPVTPAERLRQELEADDCASEPAVLAGFLRRVSPNQVDELRARRLLHRAALKGQQEAGAPRSG